MCVLISTNEPRIFCPMINPMRIRNYCKYVYNREDDFERKEEIAISI